MKTPLPLGYIVMTAGLATHCETSQSLCIFCQVCLGKHSRGDWGQVDAHDRALNDQAAKDQEGRILSSYPIPGWLRQLRDLPDDRIWIMTYPGDHTTLLFPSEY